MDQSLATWLYSVVRTQESHQDNTACKVRPSGPRSFLISRRQLWHCGVRSKQAAQHGFTCDPSGKEVEA